MMAELLNTQPPLLTSSELKGLEAPTKSPPLLLHVEFAPAITAKLFDDEAVFPNKELAATSTRPPLVMSNEAWSVLATTD